MPSAMFDRSTARRHFRFFAGVSALCVASACGDQTASPDMDAGDDASSESPNSDAALADAALADAEGAADVSTAEDACAPFVPADDCVIPSNSALPETLACTGLYADFAARTAACDVLTYTPALTLYSDGAEKHRFVRIPAGSTIDASDPNDLIFPVGTQFWKEFRVGPEKQLGETRLLQKTQRGWVYTSYVWSADGSTALQNNDGVTDLFGTGHDVPTRDQCNECHVGRKDFILGWDTFSLGSGALGLDADTLATRGLLQPGQTLPTHTIVGDADTQQALTYLHMNCGVSCHNPNPKSKAFDTGLMLRLEVADLGSTPAALRTGVDRVPNDNAKLGGLTVPPGGYVDIAKGDPTRSLILARMKVRGVDAQMPRFGSNVVDAENVAVIERWISGL